MIITISILSFFMFVTLFSFGKSRENNSINILKNDLTSFIYTVADISYSNKERFDLKFDFNSKLIFVEKDDNILMSFELPKYFDYEDAYGRKALDRNTTETGNINSSFSIYSFDKEGNAVFRQTFLNNRKFIKYVVINQYEPKCKISEGEHTIFENWKKIE